MTTETQTTGWDRALIFARWMRDQFASFFASFWLYIILWAVVLGAFSVLLYIDGIFSRGLAPDSINPLSFQAMGWCYRLFAASFLMAAARCRFKGLRGGSTFKWLGAFASVIVCLHAFGFGFEALSDRRDQATAVREIVEIAEASNQDQIAVLEQRKAQIDTDLNAAVTALNAEIRQYITDGLNNDDLADSSRERRDTLQDDARAQKQAIDDQILALVAGGAEERTQAVSAATEFMPWHPLFIGLAQLFTWTKEPTDWAIYLSAVGFIIFWVLLAESLVIFLPERIYEMHMHDAEFARTRDDDILAKARQVAAGWKAAETTKARKAREEGEKRLYQAGTRNDPDREAQWAVAIAAAYAQLEKQPKLALSAMAERFFWGYSEHELATHMGIAVQDGIVDQEDYDRLLRIPAVTNGAESEFTPFTGDSDADDVSGDQPHT